MAKGTRVNREITAPNVRLVGLDGAQIGVVTIEEALRQAEELGQDLVEIAPGAEPPVARILDWGKYRYEQTKQDQRNRRNQHQVDIKQIRLRLKIGDHDLDVKLKRATGFLEAGHKVKISLMFRGREITHPELGTIMMARVKERLAEVGTEEQAPQLSGRSLDMVIGPKKDAKA